MRPLVYTGIWRPSQAKDLDRVMVSVNALAGRRSDFAVRRWILDSGAFTRLSRRLDHLSVGEYASLIRRWSACGTLEAAVCQDWMCEPHILSLTGLTVAEHQQRTTDGWLALKALDLGVYVMPVIQGFKPGEYAAHAETLAPHLETGAWVGVGSVCKRQGRPRSLSAVLTAILRVRPDLLLHGFGVKRTALRQADIAGRLYSVDSMAWSYAGRRLSPQRNNDASYAREWTEEVQNTPVTPSQGALL